MDDTSYGWTWEDIRQHAILSTKEDLDYLDNEFLLSDKDIPIVFTSSKEAVRGWRITRDGIYMIPDYSEENERIRRDDIKEQLNQKIRSVRGK